MPGGGKNATRASSHKMKKARFIINASVGGHELLTRVEGIIGYLIMNQVINHVDVAFTHHQKDAMVEAEKMRKGEYDFVAVVGGDGTIHDAINGVMIGGSETPIAIISAGTANYLARLLEIKGDKESFCRMIMAMNMLEVDVGRVNDRYFINSAACGLLANGAFQTSMESKMVLGRMAYIIQGARSVPKNFSTARLRFQSEEFSGEKDVMLFVARNAGTMYGGKKVDARKMMSDGLLDILIVEKMDVMKVSALFYKFMRGEPPEGDGVTFFRTKSLDVEQIDGKPLILDFDKERFGHLPIHLEVLQKALRIIV